ncbi:Na(+)/dicarboxylate cotransporter 3-like [Glandiceps talaboti]
MDANANDTCRYLWHKRDILIIILTPLLLSPILIFNYDSQAARCGFVVVLVVCHWITLAVPLPVTGIMVFFWLPILEILPMADVAVFYMIDFLVLFLGILIIVSAVEKYELHRRIALRVLLLAGSDPKWLLLALMSVSGFLSMWILNIPLLLMMLPIVTALVERLNTSKRPRKGRFEDGLENGKSQMEDNDHASNSIEMEVLENGTSEGVINGISSQETEMNAKYKSNVALVTPETSEISSLQTSFYLGLVYSGTIGGAASLFGTLTQVIMVSFLESTYGTAAKISFGDWMSFSLPVQIVCLLLCWAWLAFFYLSESTSCRKKSSTKKTPERSDRNTGDDDVNITDALREEYESLGRIKWAEVVILVVFGCLILVWFFENPSFMNGWTSFFKAGYVTNGTITMGIVSICFALPSTRPSCNLNGIGSPYEPLLDWKYVQKNIDWGIFLLAGGILSISEAMKVSKLDEVIGEQFEIIQSWSPWVVLVSATLICTVSTELLSSSMMLTLLMPVLESTAAKQDVHPYYYVVAITLGLNFAFCLPAGNLGNAIVVTGGYVKIPQLIKSGLFMNIAGLIVVNIAMNTYGRWVLQLDTIPEWALQFSEAAANTTPTISMELSTMP